VVEAGCSTTVGARSGRGACLLLPTTVWRGEALMKGLSRELLAGSDCGSWQMESVSLQPVSFVWVYVYVLVGEEEVEYTSFPVFAAGGSLSLASSLSDGGLR